MEVFFSFSKLCRGIHYKECTKVLEQFMILFKPLYIWPNFDRQPTSEFKARNLKLLIWAPYLWVALPMKRSNRVKLSNQSNIPKMDHILKWYIMYNNIVSDFRQMRLSPKYKLSHKYKLLVSLSSLLYLGYTFKLKTYL